jgi:hypothetical protein
MLNPERVVGADRVALACPSGRTVFLEGNGPPQVALLVFLDGRPVGGGATNVRGAYRLPLTTRERPGIYSVDVQTRAERTVVGQFTCYVDVPFDTAPTATPEIVVTVAPPSVPGDPTATPEPAGVTPTATPATQPGLSTPTATSSAGSPPARPTATPTPTAEPDEESDASLIVIDEIALREPEQADNPRAEYVVINNDSDATINLNGWQIVNTSRSDRLTYTFPTYIFESNFTVIVFSGAGVDEPDQGEFYWGEEGDLWNDGDEAELRDNTGRVISTYTVGE